MKTIILCSMTLFCTHPSVQINQERELYSLLLYFFGNLPLILKRRLLEINYLFEEKMTKEGEKISDMGESIVEKS